MPSRMSNLENLEQRLEDIALQINLSSGKHHQLIENLRNDLLSKEWAPHRALAFQRIKEFLNEDFNMVAGREQILKRNLQSLLLLEFKEFNEHLDNIFEAQKSKVYPHGTDTNAEAKKIISEIKGHDSFLSLDEEARKKISSFLETKKPAIETILYKQQSRHADGKVISSLWNALCQAVRSIFMSSTTAKHAQGELGVLNSEVKKRNRP